MTESNQDENQQNKKLDLLSKTERRILGTLIEKSLTTPEYYPLTLKALMNGCNQKSNRSPLTSYDEYDLEQVLDRLRGRGLIAAVQSAGSRTERYRHLLRESTGWNNSCLAIMGELLLRGRQQLGELRSRSSRMSPIESLSTLREELQQLISSGYIASTGDIARRGIEVDHARYTEAEQEKKLAGMLTGESIPTSKSHSDKPVETGAPIQPTTSQDRQNSTPESTPVELEELRQMIKSLEKRVEKLENAQQN